MKSKEEINEGFEEKDWEVLKEKISWINLTEEELKNLPDTVACMYGRQCP